MLLCPRMQIWDSGADHPGSSPHRSVTAVLDKLLSLSGVYLLLFFGHAAWHVES